MPKRFFSEFEDKDNVNSWSDKNELKPHQVKISSRKKIIFKCNKCLHEFESVLNSVTGNGSWCPYCSINILCGKETCTLCFEKSFSSFDDKDKVNCWSDKNILKPIEVSKGSGKKIIFKCKCGHEFESGLNNVTGKNRTWCPFCSNNKLCGQESCTSCSGKSFLSFDDKDKLNCWSYKNILKPIEVFKNSNTKFIFKCKKCDHEFESSLNSVTRGRWCPFCSNNKLCGQESCTYCYEKSFASFDDKDKVKCWSDKNILKPIEVFKGGDQKIIFKCNKCSHEFESIISSITNGGWCIFCANKNLCGQESCTSCFVKSFASFDKDKLKCWSDKNRFKPIEVFKNSRQKIIFKCKCGNEFKSRIDSVTKKNGTWCPFCNASKNKFIRKLFEIFDKMNMKYNVEVSVKCEGRNLRWDMIVYNNEREFYIESDGEQHFSVKGLMVFTRVNIPNEEEERKFKDQRDRDLLKEKHIIDNNKLLFRISYRQFDQLEELVQEMISKSDENHKGVVKMDDIYW